MAHITLRHRLKDKGEAIAGQVLFAWKSCKRERWPSASSCASNFKTPYRRQIWSKVSIVLNPRGPYFGPKPIFIPPPKSYIFFPYCDMCFSTPIVAFLPSSFPILHLFYPFISPFLIFFPLSFFFFYIFLFSLCLFIFFPPNEIGWYFFSPRGRGLFSNIWTPA